MELTPRDRTAVEMLLRLDGCDRVGARFVQRSGQATFYPYAEVLARAKGVAGALQARGVRPGERVAIILPTCIEFLDTYLGVMLAGGIPAALYPPLRLGRLDEYLDRTRGMLERIGARLLVTDRRIRRLLGPVVQRVRSVYDVADADNPGPAGRWTPPALDPDSPAFLQFSSGTTIEPKAVAVSHVNLLSNLGLIDGCFQGVTDEENERGGVCWLPLYHDMGLLGCMFTGLYHPGTVTYISPELFIAKPALWLQTVSRYKAVVSPAPDFAYGLCTAKIKDEEMENVDLSSWRIAFNGAEPIDINLIQAFAARFARWGFRPEAMTPVYGLAEAGLAVTFSDPDTPPRVTEFDRHRLSERGEAVAGSGRRLVSVGRPLPGLDLEIRDTNGAALPPGRVGIIAIRGSSVTRGYFNNPELSAKTIQNGWLDTGDLGFLHGGELHITGRKKDLIIIRGRNYAPQEVEHLLSGLAGLRTGCVVALGTLVEGQGEQLIVLAERASNTEVPDEQLIEQIRERIAAGLSLSPHEVRILAPGTLPRTSSGKLRRAEALRLYQSETLSAPEKVDALLLAKEIGKSKLAWGRFWFRKATRTEESKVGDS